MQEIFALKDKKKDSFFVASYRIARKLGFFCF